MSEVEVDPTRLYLFSGVKNTINKPIVNEAPLA